LSFNRDGSYYISAINEMKKKTIANQKSSTLKKVKKSV
jgi:hypothetical protein